MSDGVGLRQHIEFVFGFSDYGKAEQAGRRRL
jgi:hypothetical protein